MWNLNQQAACLWDMNLKMHISIIIIEFSGRFRHAQVNEELMDLTLAHVKCTKTSAMKY